MAKKFKIMKILDYVAVVLLLVGGINWGLMALNFNLVETLLNMVGLSILSNIIYGLVGLSAIEVIIRTSMRKFMK